MRRPGSVQSAHVGLEGIEDGVVSHGNGQYRAVLEVDSLDFGMRGEGDQEAVVASYAAFLNGLSFPVQILVRVLPIDLQGYLGGLERRARTLSETDSEALADLARDHVAYLRRLARSRTLLERRFYVVVPAQSEPGRARRWSTPWRTAGPGPSPEAAHRQLLFRCAEVTRQLGRCGLTAQRLDSAALARLFYACWCPELARVQHLRGDLTDHTALVVRSRPPQQSPPAEERSA